MLKTCVHVLATSIFLGEVSKRIYEHWPEISRAILSAFCGAMILTIEILFPVIEDENTKQWLSR